MKLFTTCLLLSFYYTMFSQSESNYGYADKSIPELSQFEYYRGEWKSEMEMRQEDGTFTKLEAIGTIKGKFLEDHKTFQSQFTNTNSFFSTDIRTFNTTSKQWEALFLNATAQRWHDFTSSIVNG
ncbi:MAG: hypothetical protein Q8O72_09230 [Bacteroidales bacterium]|nr:hypothetical protein [Bacteroidales bacterium]